MGIFPLLTEMIEVYKRRERESFYPEKGKCGGADQNRTDDLLGAIQALSQLSYGPTAEGANCTQCPDQCPR